MFENPTTYRLFGDKDGLLEAVAEYVMTTYVSAKDETVEAASATDADRPARGSPCRLGDADRFRCRNPALFRLRSDLSRVLNSPAAQAGERVLELRIRRVAMTGRLPVNEQRAVDLIQSAGIGVIQTLLSTLLDRLDPGLAPRMFEAVLGQILTDVPERTDGGWVAAAVALLAITSRLDMLSEAERKLSVEWLDRATQVATHGTKLSSGSCEPVTQLVSLAPL